MVIVIIKRNKRKNKTFMIITTYGITLIAIHDISNFTKYGKTWYNGIMGMRDEGE